MLLFDFELREWAPIKLKGFGPSSRWLHGLTVQYERVFIFGGSNYEEGLCNTNVYMCDINEKVV